jgi:MoaA/NifB/PqqE/SkfB family radical SAM enzyme
MCLVSFSREKSYSALKKISSQSLIPTWGYVEINNNCSHSCNWCYGEYHKKDGYMTPETLELVLKRFQDIGVRQISISGGEPTEHPQFREFLAICRKYPFETHILTHGANLNPDLNRYMADQGVKQVQINWQGSRLQTKIHGAEYHDKFLDSIKDALDCGIEIVTNVTIGKYNMKYVAEIFQEAADLGVTRIRVWEAAGLGEGRLKGLTPLDVFEKAREEAFKLGYTHILSYDPLFEGDVSIPCMQVENVFLWITWEGKLRGCGCINVGDQFISNFISEELQTDTILKAYNKYNENLKALTDDCAVRYYEKQKREGVTNVP